MRAEDLQKVSGAGLYDSIANVDVSDKAALGSAMLPRACMLSSCRAHAHAQAFQRVQRDAQKAADKRRHVFGGGSKAVSLVWQSLWTKRAALSRRAAGMKHTDAAMGVLVQQMITGCPQPCRTLRRRSPVHTCVLWF